MSRKREKFIEHMGVVDRVEGKCAWVRIVSAPSHDCSGCSLGESCGGGAATGMTVRVDLEPRQQAPAVGDNVKVIASGVMPAKAATLLMGVPLLIFTVLLIGGGAIGMDEVLALLLALAAAAVFLLGAGMFWRRRTLWHIASC